MGMMIIGLMVLVVMVGVSIWRWLMVIKLAHFLEWLKNPPVFLLVFIILYIYTYCSLELSTIEGDTYKHLYDVLRVFTLSANDFHLDKLTWAKDWGLLIMVWVDAFFMVTAFLSLATESLVRWVLAKGIPNKHIIIFGLGTWGLHYAKTLSASGIDVVVIEKEPRDAAVREVVETWSQSSKIHRIHLIIGDCLDKTVLEKAKFKSAGKILPMLKDDGENINAAYFVRGLKSGDEQVDGQVILLPVDDVRLSTSLAMYKRFAEHANKTEIRFFNAMQQACVRHLMRYPPELYADIFEYPSIHFAIHGLGDMAINLIYVIGHLCHYRTFKKVRVTIVDQDVKKAEQEMSYLFPEIGQVLDIAYEESAIIDGIATNNYFLPELKEDDSQQGIPPVTQHFFCFKDETLSVRCAIKLRRQQMKSKRLNTPIFVRSKDGKGLSKLIDSNCGDEEWPDNIFPLVILSDDLNDDIYFSDSIEKIAKSFNAGVFEEAETPDEMDKRLQNAWRNLSSDFKHSSFFQAAYLKIRLCAIGYEWVNKPGQKGISNDGNTPAKYYTQILGLLEHKRYKSERWLLGWTYGKRTLADINRSHPELEDVGQNDKWNNEYDLAQAKQLPQLLGQAGYALVKKQISDMIPSKISEVSNASEIWFNLMDYTAREKIKGLLEKHKKDGMHSFYGLLPLPFEIIKGLAELLEKNGADAELKKFICGEEECNLTVDIAKVAGMVGTYIEMPLDVPFCDWLKEEPSESLKHLEQAIKKTNDYVAHRALMAVLGHDLNLAEPGVCAQKACKKAIPVKVSFAISDGICETKEGSISFKRGDAILTGVEGEQWPIVRSKFDATYEPVALTKAGENGTYTKRSIKVDVLQMNEPFYVDVSWGAGRLDGKPGDWLIQYGPNDYGVVSQSIFEKTYDFVGG